MRRALASILKLFLRDDGTVHDAARGATLKASLLASFAFALLFCAAAPEARATTFTVVSNGNNGDNNAGNGTCSTGGGNGVCTLRAAIEEVNALAAGAPHTINFNIPGGTLAAATITVTGTTLPPITRAGTVINATTQPNNNAGTFGTSGTVGIGLVALPAYNRPDVVVVDGGGFAVGLDVQAGSVTIRGLCIYGFGITPNADTSGNIRVGNVSGTLITQNLLGTTATSFTDPGAGVRSPGDNIRVTGGDGGTVSNNLIGYSNGKGIQIGNGANTWTITGNEVRGNGIDNSNLDGIDIENASGGATISGNLFWENEACGVDMYASAGGNNIVNNTMRRNGRGPNANLESMGVRVFGVGSTIQLNIIESNFGAGVTVTSASTGNRITRNSIFSNGTITGKTGGGPSAQIGIDLNRTTDNENVGTSPFVTVNDAGDVDGGGNNLHNFAVLVGAVISGGNLTLSGYARSGSEIEFFIAAPDPTGFGEGQTYLITLTEGTVSDTDTTTGTYGPGLVGGVNVGTDTTTLFRFTVPVPGGVSAGTRLTATATVSSNTSEFSNNITVVNAPVIGLCKTFPGQTCTPPPSLPAQQPGADVTYVINFTNTGGSPASGFNITDGVPTNTDFKVGSPAAVLGTTGLTVALTYSNNGGATYAYTPVSGGGGASPGYDRTVTHVRWTFTGNLSQTSPNNAGNVSFIVRIR